MVAKALIKTGATVRSRSMMCNAVVQTVLLYEIKSWVVTEAMLKMLEGFHHGVDWRIAGM